MAYKAGAIALVAAGLMAAPALAHDCDRYHESGFESSRKHSGEVRDVQEKLAQMGYDVGSADGHMGPRTRSALRTFQKDRGLEQTGRLDDHTLAALERGEDDSATSGRR